MNVYNNSWTGCKYKRIRSDNTTAVAYRNNMGVLVSSSSDRLAK